SLGLKLFCFGDGLSSGLVGLAHGHERVEVAGLLALELVDLASDGVASVGQFRGAGRIVGTVTAEDFQSLFERQHSGPPVNRIIESDSPASPDGPPYRRPIATLNHLCLGNRNRPEFVGPISTYPPKG